VPGNVRPLIKILEAVGLDPPANTTRSQEQIFLNYALQDLERLSPPIAHPHSATRETSPASGAFNFSGIRIKAGSRGARVTYIVNFQAAGNVLFAISATEFGTWNPPKDPDNNWGGAATAQLQIGFVNLLAGLPFPFLLQNRGDTVTESDTPIPLYQGDSLYIVNGTLNAASDHGVAWDEPL